MPNPIEVQTVERIMNSRSGRTIAALAAKAPIFVRHPQLQSVVERIEPQRRAVMASMTSGQRRAVVLAHGGGVSRADAIHRRPPYQRQVGELTDIAAGAHKAFV